MDWERNIIVHLSDKNAMQFMLNEGMREELLSDSDIRKMFTLAKTYYNDSRLQAAIPREVLESEFEEYFTLEGYPISEPVLINLVVDKLKQVYRGGRMKEVMRAASDTMVESPGDALDTMLHELSLIRMQSSTRDRLEIYGENIEQRVEDYFSKAAALERGETVYYPMGWDELTEEVFGIQPRELVILAGFAGMGKSWAVEKIALEAAKAGVKTYLASFENSKEMTFARLDCLYSGVPYREFERGELNHDQIQRMKEARAAIMEIDNLIIDTPRYEEERTLFDVYHRALYYGTELFVGDQLSWIHNPKRFKEENPYWKLGDTVRSLADITRSMNMASVWAHQFNRESQKGKHKQGQMQHMAGTSEIERYADWIYGLSATDEMKIAEKRVLTILKARRGRDNRKFLMDWRLTGETKLDIVRIDYEWD